MTATAVDPSLLVSAVDSASSHRRFWLATCASGRRPIGRLARPRRSSCSPGWPTGRAHGTLRGEIHDVLASDDHVVVLQTTRGERDGHGSLEDREAIVLHVRDGTIVEVWEHPGDVYAMDAFFS